MQKSGSAPAYRCGPALFPSGPADVPVSAGIRSSGRRIWLIRLGRLHSDPLAGLCTLFRLPRSMGQTARSSILFSAGFVPVQDVSTFISIPQAFPHCKGDFAPLQSVFYPAPRKSSLRRSLPPSAGSLLHFCPDTSRLTCSRSTRCWQGTCCTPPPAHHSWNRHRRHNNPHNRPNSNHH